VLRFLLLDLFIRFSISEMILGSIAQELSEISVVEQPGYFLS